MRTLITGATGMAGSHLADLLLAQGHDVHITVRPRSRMDNVRHIMRKVTVHVLDVRATSAVDEVVRQGQFDWVFHLAAQSSVPMSWRMPDETMQSNVCGTLNLLEAVRKWSSHTVVHIAGSSEQYGLVFSNDLPIRESQAFRPLSPYAVSKITQEHLALQYGMSYQLSVVVTRAFNHEGPRRWETSAPAGFAMQIAELEAGMVPPIVRIGNLDAIRDYLDVRDVVRAYVSAVEQKIVSMPLNVCSGHGWTIREVLDYLLTKIKFPVEIEVDPGRLRPSDVPALVGDGTAFCRITGWTPTIPFEVTLDDMLSERRRLVSLMKDLVET